MNKPSVKNRTLIITIWFLKIANKHNLYFKWSKCDFDVEEIPILRVVVK